MYIRPEILSLDYSYMGLPFVMVCANPNDNQLEMDFSYYGLPFVSNCSLYLPINVNKVSWRFVDKFLGVNSENVTKIAGVEPI